jgi:hypothetical protein
MCFYKVDCKILSTLKAFRLKTNLIF